MTQAVVFEKFGLEHLKTVERDPGPPGPGEVRIKVRATSLNYRDYLMVMGLYNPRLEMPLIPLSDGAGEVVEVGQGVTGLTIGDRVCSTMIPDWESGEADDSLFKSTLGGPAMGLLCTEQTLPERALMKIPDWCSYQEAACLPVAGLTAWRALNEANIGAGSKVLLLGTGGVSIMALGIAQALGAESVITSSSDEKLKRAAELGANHCINYKTHPKWAKEVQAIYPSGVDAVVEVGGVGTFDQSAKAVKFGGCISLIGVLSHTEKPVNLTAILMRNIKVQGILVGSREHFAQYLAFLEKNQIKPCIDKVFTGLNSAPEAFKLMASGGHFGKIVIEI